MANNFKNSFVSVSSAGEYYQSNATDSLTGPQTVYTANNGSGVNSILIELDAANTGASAITATAYLQDTSATLGTITSIASSSDTATVTCAGAHGLQTGMYVNVTGSTTNYVNGIYKITRTGANTFTYTQNSSASDGSAAGTIVIYKAFHIVKDAPIPPQSTLKIVSGQKVVLNSNDKVLVYGSAATLDVVASILEDVT
tara:strand:+ start:10197 stop:10793 length:597 start_codon:yes stop_codon:yes gene_type:complete